MRCCLTWKCDPGPCPVDDTPHTACTPESVLVQRSRNRQIVTVAVQPPRVFSTKTYRGDWPGVITPASQTLRDGRPRLPGSEPVVSRPPVPPVKPKLRR